MLRPHPKPKTEILKPKAGKTTELTCAQYALILPVNFEIAPRRVMFCRMDFLQLQDRQFLVFGVANRKSVAYAVGQILAGAGAKVVYVVRDAAVLESVRKLLAPAPIFTCDVADEAQVAGLANSLKAAGIGPLHGLVHSLAFANYTHGFGPFHETHKADFLQAMDISCFSLVSLVRHLKPLLDQDASVVTMSISTTRMAAENYGYMAPIKAAWCSWPSRSVPTPASG